MATREIVRKNVLKGFRIQYNKDGTFQHTGKGKKTGVYANTSENRKLGRVGQKYKKEKEEEEEEKEYTAIYTHKTTGETSMLRGLKGAEHAQHMREYISKRMGWSLEMFTHDVRASVKKRADAHELMDVERQKNDEDSMKESRYNLPPGPFSR